MTRREFAKKFDSQYRWLLENSPLILDTVLPRKKVPNKYYNIDRCREESGKYTSRGDWRRGHRSSYDSASKNGWLDICTPHMTVNRKSKGYWSLELCKEEAFKYKNKSSWKRGHKSYYAARDRGWLDECCAHMKPLTNSKK